MNTPKQTSWKDHLLKSGVPLEYDVARILSRAKMIVDADVSYIRKHGNERKEFSTDISATWYHTDASDDHINFRLDALIECKYRSQDKTMLFLPDREDAYSPATLGGTIKIFDQYSPLALESHSIAKFEEPFQFVYKGIEVHNNGAYEEELRHGIQQLRYATPSTIMQTLDFIAHSHPEDRMPLFFTKILATNASLRVLNEDIDIERIKAASSLNDISRELGSVILFSDYGPDFEEHFRATFSDNHENRYLRAQEIRRELKFSSDKHWDPKDPVQMVEQMSKAERYICRSVGTQFFITTLNNLPILIKDIQDVCTACHRGGKKRKTSKSK